MEFVFEEEEGHEATVGVFLFEVDVSDPVFVALLRLAGVWFLHLGSGAVQGILLFGDHSCK